MKVGLTCVDLFSGLGGFSQAMVDRGWKVVRADNNLRFNPDICADVRDLTEKDFPENVDLVLASPPCNCFSCMTIGRYWRNGLPTRKALEAIGLVQYTVMLIKAINPRFWVLENPMGMLRRILGEPDVHTFFAAWGERRKKPTDLWGKIPSMAWPKPENWIKCPRGTKDAGIQDTKLSPDERAKIPYKLSEALAVAVERTTLDYFVNTSGEAAAHE